MPATFPGYGAALEAARCHTRHTTPASYYVFADGEIAPELTGHGLPLAKCEAYNRVYDQHARSG